MTNDEARPKAGVILLPIEDRQWRENIESWARRAGVEPDRHRWNAAGEASCLALDDLVTVLALGVWLDAHRAKDPAHPAFAHALTSMVSIWVPLPVATPWVPMIDRKVDPVHLGSSMALLDELGPLEEALAADRTSLGDRYEGLARLVFVLRQGASLSVERGTPLLGYRPRSLVRRQRRPAEPGSDRT